MIRVINNRDGGSLFHYAHFLCDCLFPEIINDIYEYDEIVRIKNIHQTIGNFHLIYNQVMRTKNTELLNDEFNKLNTSILSYEKKEKYCHEKYFNKFRNFIFSRYNIDSTTFDPRYPEVILIKRSGRIRLIDDEYLAERNFNVSTGRERREMDRIEDVQLYLENMYGGRFMSLYFEHIPFEEQVRYFCNARLIICAHGAVMSNLFFCKPGTTVIEITCGTSWEFFDKITKLQKLHHVKCHVNRYDNIIRCITKCRK